MNKHDIEELQSILQGEYIEESTSRSLKEVKQYQQDKSKHSDVTDKVGFHKLIKKKMETTNGYENATGSSGVTTSKTGTTKISLTSTDFKIDSPAEKLFNRLFDIVKNFNGSTTQISTATRKELFDILGLPDNQWDIYPNRCFTKSDDKIGFKTLKLEIFKSTGRTRVFPKVGYRFFHASNNPDIHKEGLCPSLGSTHGFTNDQGQVTINRSYNKKSCFFMAIKNDKKLIENIARRAFTYGSYVYEYKPRRGDIFYEDLFSRPGHTSAMKDPLNIPGAIPVFINTNTNLPVKKINHSYKNLYEKNRFEGAEENNIMGNSRARKNAAEELKKIKNSCERKLFNTDHFLDEINTAKTYSDLMSCMLFIPLNIPKNVDDAVWDIIKKNEDVNVAKKEMNELFEKYKKEIVKQSNLDKQSAYRDYKYIKQKNDIAGENLKMREKRFKDNVKRYGVFESYIDENDNDDYITEANEESKKARKNAQEFMRKEYGTSHPTSMTSKQRNRMKRWLTDNDYDPKTETIATDIIDKKTGKPVRVNVGTNAYALDPDVLGHPAKAFAVPNNEEYRKYLSDTLLRDGRGYINMPLSEMKRHPSVSNGISKHEEGHIADMQYGEKMVGKRNGRRKLEKINIEDYGPHLNQDELAADVYSVQHNKYKDKLGFIKRLSSSDVKARKSIRHDLNKVYKSFYDGNLKDVDMTDINNLKTILKNMIKDSETELKYLKQIEKLNDNDTFRANVTGIENGIKSYKQLLEKVEKITPDEFKGEFKRAVFKSYKPYFVEVLKVFDRESELRADFAKRYIKEFATEYDMSTMDVIQEMYLQDMEDYVFQEESESVESYIDETIERFDAFMEEFNNGQISNSEFIMESAQDNEYAKIVRDYIKKSGRRYFRYKRGEDYLPKEVEDKIFDLAKKIVEFPPNGDYSQYKMYYQSFCRIVNYPIDTVIMGMMINDAHNGYINMGALGGYRGAKRCVLKPGTHLFHSSDNPNLTMINPNHFKGKPNIIEIGDEEIPTGDYDSYYACPRIYFHVEKMGSRQASAYGTVKYDSNNMPIIENKPTSGHMYMYIVKPTDRIFFDPELNSTNDKDGAVYMLIDKPVRLTKIY